MVLLRNGSNHILNVCFIEAVFDLFRRECNIFSKKKKEKNDQDFDFCFHASKRPCIEDMQLCLGLK